MVTQQRPDDLARLTALVQTQQARLARLERRRRIPRHILPLLLAALLVALVPLVTLAANPFTDLNPGSPHNTNIDAIYNAGITTGCVPNAEYCPNGLVTREEMASFLARTAGVGGNPPVANAKTAQTATTAQNAQNAGNANTVGGYAPGSLMRVARAIQAERYENVPPTVIHITATYPAFQSVVTLAIEVPGPGFLLVDAALLGGATSGTSIIARLRDPLTGEASPVQAMNLAGGSNLIASLGLVHVFPVTAGSRAVVLDVAKGGAGTADVTNGEITALYVPFGPSGGSALDLP